MTERFTLDYSSIDSMCIWIDDNFEDKSYEIINDTLSQSKHQEIVDLLNNLNDECDYWRKRALLLENKYGEHDDDRE